jgi:hypothetical protein
MEITEVLKLADELVFHSDGKASRLYARDDTARDFEWGDLSRNCAGTYASAGHVRDTGAELWKILSESLGKEVSKSNCRAILEKANFYNSASAIVGDNAKVTNVICPEHHKRASPT